MRHSAVQYVSALGVLVALAAFDLGPRAAAAYQSVAATASATDDLGMSGRDDAPVMPRELAPKGQKRVTQVDALYLPGNGGMSSPSSTTSPDGPTGAGCLPSSDPPAGGLVVYFREPVSAFVLSAFIDSLLDPPRPA